MFAFFLELTGERKLPKPRVIEGKGKIYVVKTPQGNFNLRDFARDPTADGSKPRWTIDIPRGMIGSKRKEIKFK